MINKWFWIWLMLKFLIYLFFIIPHAKIIYIEWRESLNRKHPRILSDLSIITRLWSLKLNVGQLIYKKILKIHLKNKNCYFWEAIRQISISTYSFYKKKKKLNPNKCLLHNTSINIWARHSTVLGSWIFLYIYCWINKFVFLT